MALPVETRKLIQSTAREAAKAVSSNVASKAVKDTLVSCGIDPTDPISAQEMHANMRKVAASADDLAAIAAHYRDPETIEAIQFAKDANKVYRSTRNRVVAGVSATVFTVWVTGLWDKVQKLWG